MTDDDVTDDDLEKALSAPKAPPKGRGVDGGNMELEGDDDETAE